MSSFFRSPSESDLVFAVGIGEQRLDLFLIRDALGGAAAAHTNIRNPVSEHTRKLGTVLVSCYLERGQFHGCIHSLLIFSSKGIILHFLSNVNSKILNFSREKLQSAAFPGRKYQNIYIEKPEKYAIMSAE